MSDRFLLAAVIPILQICLHRRQRSFCRKRNYFCCRRVYLKLSEITLLSSFFLKNQLEMCLQKLKIAKNFNTRTRDNYEKNSRRLFFIYYVLEKFFVDISCQPQVYTENSIDKFFYPYFERYFQLTGGQKRVPFYTKRISQLVDALIKIKEKSQYFFFLQGNISIPNGLQK